MSEKKSTPAAEGEIINPKPAVAPNPEPVGLSAVYQDDDDYERRTSPEFLISQAIEKTVPIETMEKLLVMRRELKAERAKEKFDEALSGFQADIPIIEKTKKVYEKNNPNKVRYTYAPLDVIIKQVKPFLKTYGLSYSIDTEFNPDWQTVVCTVKHVDGHNEKSTFKVPIDKDSYMNAPQKFASALTFAKRYAFCNAFGILSGDEDDDAQSVDVTNAARPAAPQPQRPPVQQQPRPQQPSARPMNQPAPAARPMQPAAPQQPYRAPATYGSATAVTRPAPAAAPAPRRTSTQEPTGAAGERKCTKCGWWHTRRFDVCKDCYFGPNA